MTLVLSIDAFAVSLLVYLALRKGFEAALPPAAFFLILFPVESQIHLPGVFDLTTQRVVLITLMILYATCGRGNRADARKYKVELICAMGALIGWMLISSANSVVPTISFKSVLSQCLDFFLPYYLFAKCVTRRRTVYGTMFAFILAMFICSCLGIVETYQDWSILSIFPPTAHRFGGGVFEGIPGGDRIQATFGHPILFGAGLAMAIPIALHLISLEQRFYRKAFLWVSVLLMFLCIYKTASRGPWIALACSLGVLALGGGRRLRRSLVTIALLSILVVVSRPGIWLTLENIRTATEDPQSPRGMSYQWRYALYGLAWKELGKSPGRALWGYGPESFYYLDIEDEFMGHIVKYESCDSSVAQLLIETGYVGMLFAAFAVLKAAFRTYRNFLVLDPPDKHLTLVWLTNIFTFALLMFSVAIWSWGQQATMFWIVVGLSMRLPRLVIGSARPNARETAILPADTFEPLATV